MVSVFLEQVDSNPTDIDPKVSEQVHMVEEHIRVGAGSNPSHLEASRCYS